MASRLVVCRDKGHAKEMAEAGLLVCRFEEGWYPPDPVQVPVLLKMYDADRLWPREDFAVLVEEDTDEK